MPTGGAVVPEKKQFPATVGGNERAPQQQAQRFQWFPMDERDGFISWLRGEFAAANAMIDSLCHHLRSVGEPGEYDLVIGSIQQRRCNWNSVLHMQQYFSIAEVNFSLQQVTMRKQQQNSQSRYCHDTLKGGGKEFRRSSSAGFIKAKAGDTVKEFNAESHAGVEKSEKTAFLDDNDKLETDDESAKEITADLEKPKNDEVNHESKTVSVNQNASQDDGESLIGDGNAETMSIVPRTFNAPEIIDGKTMNVADGLKLYEHALKETEVLKLVSLTNEWKAAGRKGELPGHAYIVSRRPTRGYGREVLQFGVPVVDLPTEDDNSGFSKERRVESIPSPLQEVIDHLVEMQHLQFKPDSCVIDIYSEGDHSQPNLWPSSYGKSVSTLFLTECEIVFGRVITGDHSGDYKGSLKLSLTPGSVLLMEGNSSEFARHALPSVRKIRILITFVKSHPKRYNASSSSSSSHWGTPIRSTNNVRHPATSRSSNHFPAGSATGVLPAPPMRPQAMYIAPIPYPTSAPSTGWGGAGSRHPSGNRLAAQPPGTGVFLPPTGNSLADGSSEENGSSKMSNSGGLAKKEDDERGGDCNGNEEKSEAR